MGVINKKVMEWINLFNRLDELKRTYGYSFFKDAIFWLDCLSQKKLVTLGNKSKLVDLLVEHHIDEFDLMKDFLLQIINIFDFHSVVVKLEEAQKDYGIDSVSLVLSTQASNNVISIFHSNYGFQRAYFPKDIIPISRIDFKTGDIQLIVASHYEYILDKKEQRKCERIFWTRDFRFGSKTFPTKEKMDQYNFKDEKKKWLSYIISNLVRFEDSEIDFVLDDPNLQVMNLNTSNIYENYSILTDGLVYDENERELLRRNGYFERVFVREANVLMVCQIEQEGITKIKLIVDPIYFKEYMNGLEQDREKEFLANIFFLLKNSKKEWDLNRNFS